MKLWYEGIFCSNDDGDDVIEVIIPFWTASPLQQKWSNFVQPLAPKFITLTHSHPKKVEKRSCIIHFIAITFY
jgi:hypothetical protein